MTFPSVGADTAHDRPEPGDPRTVSSYSMVTQPVSSMMAGVAQGGRGAARPGHRRSRIRGVPNSRLPPDRTSTKGWSPARSHLPANGLALSLQDARPAGPVPYPLQCNRRKRQSRSVRAAETGPQNEDGTRSGRNPVNPRAIQASPAVMKSIPLAACDAAERTTNCGPVTRRSGHQRTSMRLQTPVTLLLNGLRD
jgi:hypothetical protein